MICLQLLIPIILQFKRAQEFSVKRFQLKKRGVHNNGLLFEVICIEDQIKD